MGGTWQWADQGLAAGIDPQSNIHKPANSLFLAMFSFWQRPFPPYVYSKGCYAAVLISGLAVFAILFFIEPFDLDEVSLSRKFLVSISFGCTTSFVTGLFILVIPKILPVLFDARGWTVGKEILFFCLLLTVVSAANVVVNMWLQKIPFSTGMMTMMIGYTLLVSAAPVTLSVLVKQHMLLRRFQSEASLFNTMLPINVEDAATGESVVPEPALSAAITIAGDNQEEQLTLSPHDWVAAEASDNYCRIYFVQGAVPDSVLFRTTLKKLENQLEKVPGLYRCHKSFLVNLEKVSHLSGNAQGYRLHLKEMELQVPVSRSLNAELKEKLAGRKG